MEIDWKEKYQEFQLLQEQMEQISMQIQQLHQQVADVEVSKKAIQEIAVIPEESKAFVPIAQGIFLKAKLEKNNEFLVHIGQQTTVIQSQEEVLQLLQKQEEELQFNIKQGEILLQQLNTQLMEIYNKVENYVQQTEKQA